MEERLDVFEQLWEESSFVQKIRARAEQKGYAEGFIIGYAQGYAEGFIIGLVQDQVQELRTALIDLIKIRYPSILELTQECANRIQQTYMLYELIHTLSTYPDEKSVCFILGVTTATSSQQA